MATATHSSGISWTVAGTFLLSLLAIGVYVAGPVVAGVATLVAWRRTAEDERRARAWLSAAAVIVAVAALLQLMGTPV